MIINTIAYQHNQPLMNNYARNRSAGRLLCVLSCYVYLWLSRATVEGFMLTRTNKTQQTKRQKQQQHLLATADFSLRKRGRLFLSEKKETINKDDVDLFLEQLESSIQTDQLLSFTLKGESTKKSKTAVRGSLRLIQGRTVQLATKKKNTKIQVTFKYHGATDVAKNWDPKDCPTNLARLLGVYSNEDNEDTAASDVVPASEWGTVKNVFHSASLETMDAVWELQNLTKKSKLIRKKQQLATGKQQQQAHDRTKNFPVPLSDPIWQALGVTTTNTNVLKSGMSKKFRQCQKFVEIVGRLVDEATITEAPISVVDMGCGRGYLTFALHSFLINKYEQTTIVSSRGIDVRPKLVKEISGIARSMGSDFDGLTFETGTIESFLQEENNEHGSNTDVLIALHACDTATDDALWSGIARDASVIVVAPCCHRQIRPQLDGSLLLEGSDNHVYQDVLRHNIYRERTAEIVTDSLRALLLEWAGYDIQVFEFIGGEHTSKNVMIVAVKHQQQHTNRTPDKPAILKRIRHLAGLHGIRQQKLAQWMGIALNCNNKATSVLSMPPLKKTS